MQPIAGGLETQVGLHRPGPGARLVLPEAETETRPGDGGSARPAAPPAAALLPPMVDAPGTSYRVVYLVFFCLFFYLVFN